MIDLTKYSIPDLEPKVKEKKKAAGKSATPVIVSGVRTAIGKFLGSLADIHPSDLGAHCIKEAISRAGVAPEDVDEVLMGDVVTAGLGQNPARQAALKAGLDPRVAAMTISKVCASGLKAIVLAAQAIALGDATIVVAGGMESMSQTPYLLSKARNGYRMGNGQLIDSMVCDGLWDPYHDFHMGVTGEIVAHHFKITREMQDEYAWKSHQKAVAAINEGRFKEEITAFPVPQRKGDPILFDTDESPREDTKVEKLAALKPAFQKDGTVTAGNAPGVNDGAAAVVLMSEEEAERRGIKPLARVEEYFTSGLPPEWVMLTPIPAVRGVLKKHGNLTISDIDLFELNEAFSVQALVCMKELGIDPEKLNVNGGAVALGHPIGASGARIMVTLIHALKARSLKKGIASLCLGGGNGVAMLVEMC
ncbi:MAG: thiolase family protein [Candidatus Xenobiia bacterium LiM19]